MHIIDKKGLPGKLTFSSTGSFRNSSSIRWCREKWLKIVTEREAEREALERSRDIDRALYESRTLALRDFNVLILGEPFSSAFPYMCACVCACLLMSCQSAHRFLGSPSLS